MKPTKVSDMALLDHMRMCILVEQTNDRRPHLRSDRCAHAARRSPGPGLNRHRFHAHFREATPRGRRGDPAHVRGRITDLAFLARAPTITGAAATMREPAQRCRPLLHSQAVTAMNIQDAMDKLATLPPQQQVEVLDFIEFLSSRRPAKARGRQLSPLREEPFIGMWENRKDMADSASWVRQVRKKEWGV